MLFLHMQMHERMAPSPFRSIDSLKTSLKPRTGSPAADVPPAGSLLQQALRKRKRRVVAARLPPKDPFEDIKEMEEKFKQEAAATKAKLKREAAHACSAKASAATSLPECSRRCGSSGADCIGQEVLKAAARSSGPSY